MKLDELALNEITRTALTQIVQRPPHTLLVIGAHGSGKQSLMQSVACQILGVDSLEFAPYVLQVSPDGSTFTIEQVRAIRDFLKLRTTGSSSIRRILLLFNAEKMNNEAQNALLKTLEEPPADTMIILGVNTLKALKSTIRSRAQSITLLPLTQEVAVDYFKSRGSTLPHINKAYMMSDGAAGLMYSLLNDDKHPMIELINEAKLICQQSSYERLTTVDTLAKDRDKVTLLLDAMQRVAKAGMRGAVAKSAADPSSKWHKQLSAIHQAQSLLPRNPNLKLLLTDLFLQM